jgi:hypothetical protein
MQKHYLCDCGKFIFREDVRNQTDCPLCECPRYKNGKPHGRYFFYFPLTEYLKREWAYNIPWARHCYYPWQGHASQPGEMTDIFDSPNWKKHPQLAEAGNIGFVFNADGKSVFKSGSYSVWPIFLMVANLPPALRYCKHYCIVPGTTKHCCSVKMQNLHLLLLVPNGCKQYLDLMLSLFEEEMLTLGTVGIEIFDSTLHTNRTLRAVLLRTICDLPARKLVPEEYYFLLWH